MASHNSLDEAVENVDLGIGTSGTSGIQIDDDSDSEEEFDEEGNPRMVSIGVQTEGNVTSPSLEGTDRVILPSSVAEPEASVVVENVASNEVEVDLALPPSPPSIANPPASVSLPQILVQTGGESEAAVVAAAVEGMDSDLVEAEAGPSNVANLPSLSAEHVDPPIAAGLEAAEKEPATSSMEVDGTNATPIADKDDDGDQTLVGDVSPSFFKDILLGNGSVMATESEGDLQHMGHEQEQRAFGRNEEDVLMASS